MFLIQSQIFPSVFNCYPNCIHVNLNSMCFALGLDVFAHPFKLFFSFALSIEDDLCCLHACQCVVFDGFPLGIGQFRLDKWNDHAGDDDADDAEQCAAFGEFAYAHERGGVLDDDAGVLESDESDEESDTGTYRTLQVGRDSVY